MHHADSSALSATAEIALKRDMSSRQFLNSRSASRRNAKIIFSPKESTRRVNSRRFIYCSLHGACARAYNDTNPDSGGSFSEIFLWWKGYKHIFSRDCPKNEPDCSSRRRRKGFPQFLMYSPIGSSPVGKSALTHRSNNNHICRFPISSGTKRPTLYIANA